MLLTSIKTSAGQELQGTQVMCSFLVPEIIFLEVMKIPLIFCKHDNSFVWFSVSAEQCSSFQHMKRDLVFDRPNLIFGSPQRIKVCKIVTHCVLK